VSYCKGSGLLGFPVGFKLNGRFVRMPGWVICSGCGGHLAATGKLVRNHPPVADKSFRLDGKETPDG
jgi:hypothetical protein